MNNILIAGFGGQGILFCGKFIVQAAMQIGKEVSWMPSYGPEMRGGTANCSVIISDAPIGSPIVDKPDILIVMNRPSMDKFENACVPSAKIFIDSSLIDRKGMRGDVDYKYIPATALADENNLTGLANMIMIGYVIKQTGIISADILKYTMEKTVPERKSALRDANLRALDIGQRF